MFTRSVAVAALAALPALATPAVNVYWGQAGNVRLRDFCDQDGFDYVTIGFVNQSPENDPSGLGYPGTNFGSHCISAYYKNDKGDNSPLLKECGLISADIRHCQKKGKKVLLSIGGVYSSPGADYSISNAQAGQEFADFVWNAFGPYNPQWTLAGKPRPFDDYYEGADEGEEYFVFDGFDFDIEHKFADPSGYIAMVQRLRELAASDSSGKKYLITAAPECPLNDEWAKMKPIIASCEFDALFVQFYNNPQCHGNNINFDAWASWLETTKSKNAKIFIGLPGSATAASGYLDPEDAVTQINKYKNKEAFGGVMVWDAYYGSEVKYGKTFYKYIRDSLIPPATTTTSSVLPTATPVCVKSYTVKSGDYCYDIANRYGLDFHELLEYNNFDAECRIEIGQVLCVRVGYPSPASTTTIISSSASASATSVTSTSTVSTGTTTSTSVTSSSSTTSATSSSSTTSTTSSSTSTSSSSSVASSTSAIETTSSTSTSTVSTTTTDDIVYPTDDATSTQTTASDSEEFATNTSKNAATVTESSATTTSTDTALPATDDPVTSTSISSTATLAPDVSSTTSSAGAGSTPTDDDDDEEGDDEEYCDDETSTTETLPSATQTLVPGVSTSTASSTGAVETTTSDSAVVTVSDEPTTTGFVEPTGITSDEPAETASGESTATASGDPIITASQSYTTSTIYATTTYTVTSCEASVTDCPARVVTETIAISTTVCPVTPTGSETSAIETVSSETIAPKTNELPAGWTTSTIYSTKTYVITSCPVTVTDCPSKIGQVTTEVVAVTTTVCPISEVSSSAVVTESLAIPTAVATKGVEDESEVDTTSTVSVTATSFTTITVSSSTDSVGTDTVKPVPIYPTPSAGIPHASSAPGPVTTFPVTAGASRNVVVFGLPAVLAALFFAV
ncbi:uncharacterized protein CTHT_0012900 [Thermochaetoides thermophila DSM 1495]|uniref:chitinase n=1 Tax=Chaetomium thermophilum (strain DSM 1495 / CBS 144.50 / IMI 039719) TaxID=759272 RepID=G0S1A4_CHATD|nr:hypothetical protein CTHT_0012900 [Thermochaetoides thermophila DSM 1495]EGS22814.1 hypothetical protein CTHT_0012900 [Thermochaetoides thermophila DSM 1495]